MMRIGRRTAGRVALLGAMAMAASRAGGAHAAGGDLSRQAPVEVLVELGTADGRHVFAPGRLRFETGRL